MQWSQNDQLIHLLRRRRIKRRLRMMMMLLDISKEPKNVPLNLLSSNIHLE